MTAFATFPAIPRREICPLGFFSPGRNLYDAIVGQMREFVNQGSQTYLLADFLLHPDTQGWHLIPVGIASFALAVRGL